MKCLSLWQPWASVIFETDHEGKPVKPDETRGWVTNVRGRIAIHAAKTLDKKFRAMYEPTLTVLGLRWNSLPLGCIVGTVDLVDCVRACKVIPAREDWQLFWGDYRHFGDQGEPRYAFVFRDPIKLPEPVPCVGRQGFFNVPDDLFQKAHLDPKSTLF